LAGGIGSGGGDLKSAEEGSAWFSGNKAVSTCTEVAPDFGYSDSQLNQLIQKSIKKWEDYTLSKLIAVRRPQEFRPSFTFIPVFKSEGVPNPHCDLTFYFGKQTNEVTDALKYYVNPLSIAQRTDYDVKTGWGKGFIWFRSPANADLNKFPDLRNQDVLEIMLTHEIGHVLGNAHRDGTIMSESIVRLIMRAGDAVKVLDYDKIDQQRELVACDDCNLEYKMRPWGDNRDLASKLFGRPAVGQIKIWALVGSLGSLTLVLRDDGGEVKYPVHFLDVFNSTYADTLSSFKVVRVEPRLNQPVIYFERAIGHVQYGSITAPSNTELGVLIERNSDAGPLSISITFGDRIARLAAGELCSDSFRTTNQRCNL
jgi:hypothetical protein